jgi:deoxyribonuclease-4
MESGKLDFDEFGAHVSTSGGVALAPARAREIESVCLQLFTKQPNRWAEPLISPDEAGSFQEARRAEEIRVAGSHDSYLINLATPRADLWIRSFESFRRELARCCALGLDFLVTHPGNATDGDRASGIARNSEGITRALEEVQGPTRVFLELTAGGGTTVGGSFQDLAEIRAGIPSHLRDRVGICFDTCHAFAAGYDLRTRDACASTFAEFERVVGFRYLRGMHLNDAKSTFCSRVDRHENLGKGNIGMEVFRYVMNDPRFDEIPLILETPDENQWQEEIRMLYAQEIPA